ncbi:MAG: SBBP repeat-containing protein, partial [Promethearchaeota archaeon]
MRKSDLKKFILIILLVTTFLPLFIPRLSSIENKSVGVFEISSKFQWNETIINDGPDEGNSIILDNNGDILVTGSIYNSSKLTNDLFIIKYSSNGSAKWNSTWGSSSEDSGVSITVDLSNDIYITGYTSIFENKSYDICLLKYNSLGTLLWNRTWGGDGVDKGYGVEVDGVGNVYVGGSTKIDNGYDDVILLKFDAITGNLLKNTTWGGYYDERAQDIIIDSSGNVYLTGYTDNFGA